jgi:hypothetical protein
VPAAPPWLDDLALRPGPPWHHLGTRALEEAHRLRPPDDDEGRAQVRRKATILAEHHDDVVSQLAGDDVDAAVHELAGTHTLEQLAATVADDLCLLVSRDGTWRLVAGVVCFPSMWSLRDKLGLPLAAVHAPVPRYDEELASRVDRVLDHLRPDRPVWRRNWFVHHDPELHQPAPPPPPPAPPAVPGGLWLRSELQTLSRLPRSGAVLFTIRTQQVPLAVVGSRPDLADRMAEAIAAWSDELVAYRSAAAWRDEVVVWLAGIGGAPRQRDG